MEGRPRIGRVDLEAGRERPVRGTVTFVAFAFILLLPSANRSRRRRRMAVRFAEAR